VIATRWTARFFGTNLAWPLIPEAVLLMMPYFEGCDAALIGLPFGPLDSPLFTLHRVSPKEGNR
jgi:hypothetical protein